MRCGATARSMRIGRTPTTCPTLRRRRRIASISAPTHDARRSLQPQIGAQLERLTRSARADDGLREARYLACGRRDPGPRSSACDAAPPIRCRYAPRRIDDRSDGPQPAVDERGRVHGAPGLAGRNWIDQVVEPSADALAEQSKSGYSGVQETNMA